MTDAGTPAFDPALGRLREGLACGRPIRGWPRGVVGAFGPAGEVLYGYPEIAGYWLSWASGLDSIADAHGTAVISWLLARGSASRGWPTRIGSRSLPLDPCYRLATYLFDHCMAWRGVRRWSEIRGDRAGRRLADGLWQHLQTFVDRANPGGPRLLAAHGSAADRWSGRVGPYLLKVCAYVRGRDGPLAETCDHALSSLIQDALQRPHADAHPQLYAIEGMLALGRDVDARSALSALFAANGEPSRLREARDGGPRRCDVLAQALRAIELTGLSDRQDEQSAALAGMLARAIDEYGRLPFAIGRRGCGFPTWTALFAEQALSAWHGEALGVEDLV